MSNEDLSIPDLFSKGTRGVVTTRVDSRLPLVLRGISKKKTIKECEASNRDYYYIDTGYVGNFPSPGNPSGKKLWHRVVKNGLQHSDPIDRPNDRWLKLIKQDPRLDWKGWKPPGNKILLVLPNPKACNFYDISCDEWIETTTSIIKQQTDMPIEVRVKGSRVDRNHGYSIYDAFDSGVFATVCFNSIAALESVLYGIPAFVQVPCVASPLVSNDLSKLLTPFRPDESMIKKVCYNLAYGQFTIEEMSSGAAWNIINS